VVNPCRSLTYIASSRVEERIITSKAARLATPGKLPSLFSFQGREIAW